MSHIRPLAPRDPAQPHRAATQIELFFDLVSVIAIAAITAGLHHAISAGHGLEGMIKFALLFPSIWWAWMNFTWFASAFDNDDPLYRVLVFVIITGELMFAGGTAHIFESFDFGWGLAGWVVMRLGMIGLWLRAAAGSPEWRVTALRYAVGIGLAQACWIFIFFAVPHDLAIFGPAMVLVYLIELAVPVWAERAHQTPWHRHHMIERYGLLTIIVLGEGLLSVGLGFGLLFGEHPEMSHLVTALSGAVMTYVLWWLYFAEPEHLNTKQFWRALLWGYGHVFVFAAYAVFGAAVAAELDLAAHHSEVTQAVVARYLAGAWVVALLTLYIIRDRFVAPGVRKAALPVMAAVFALAGVLGLPGIAFAVLAVVTLLWRVPMLTRTENA